MESNWLFSTDHETPKMKINKNKDLHKEPWCYWPQLTQETKSLDLITIGAPVCTAHYSLYSSCPFAISCEYHPNPVSESELESYHPHFVTNSDIDRGDDNC